MYRTKVETALNRLGWEQSLDVWFEKTKSSVQRFCFTSPLLVFAPPAPRESPPPCHLHTDGIRQRRDHSSCPLSRLLWWLNKASSTTWALGWTLPSATPCNRHLETNADYFMRSLQLKESAWARLHRRLTLRRSWKAWVWMTLGRCWTMTRRLSSCNSVARLLTCWAHLTSGRLPINCSVPQSMVTAFCTVWMETSIS